VQGRGHKSGFALVCAITLLAALTPLTVLGGSELARQEVPGADSVRVVLQVELLDAAVEVNKPPVVSVTLENIGVEPVTGVQPGDGSRWGWRTPFVWWTRMRVDRAGELGDSWPGPPDIPRCGNMNMVWPSEVFTLQSGQIETLRFWVSPLPMRSPGRYRLQMHYWNRPEFEPTPMMHEYSPEAEPLIRASTPMRVSSNEIIVDVTEASVQAP